MSYAYCQSWGFIHAPYFISIGFRRKMLTRVSLIQMWQRLTKMNWEWYQSSIEPEAGVPIASFNGGFTHHSGNIWRAHKLRSSDRRRIISCKTSLSWLDNVFVSIMVMGTRICTDCFANNSLTWKLEVISIYFRSFSCVQITIFWLGPGIVCKNIG